MQRCLTIAILILGCADFAMADAPFARGAYISASGGPSIFDDNETFGLFFNEEDKVLQVAGGYKFFRGFAVEARFSDLGTYDNFGQELDVSAVSIGAVGLIPFGESGWELIGHIGFASINQEVDFADDTDGGVVGGVGVRWHLSRNFALGVQVDAYSWENEDLALVENLRIGTQQFVIQVNF